MAAVHARQVQDGVTPVAATDDQLTASRRIEEATCVEIVVDGEQA
jgi:hypothetical protein